MGDLPFIHASARTRCLRVVSLLLATLCVGGVSAKAADAEFTGRFEPQLVSNPEGHDDVVFTPAHDLSKFKLTKPIENASTVTVGWLFDPRSEKSAIQAL